LAQTQAPKLDISSLTPDQIKQALSQLTPDKLSAFRAMAVQAGLTPQSETYCKLPNGGVRITIELPPDTIGPIVAVAEAAGETEEGMIRQALLEGAAGWPFQSYGPEEIVPEATTTIPLGTRA